MTVDAGKRVEADVEVTDNGVTLPLSELTELGDLAVPDQRVHIAVTPPPRGRFATCVECWPAR